MLGTRHLGLTLGFLGAIFAGCGEAPPSTTDTTSSSSSSGSSSSSSSSSSGGGGEGGGPMDCPTNEGVVLAVQELYFGEGNSGEWKKVGYDLDGLTSTAQSKDLCKPAAGASASTPYPDGDMGIDNSFGKNLLPTILSLYPTWVTDINNGIQNGRFTAIVKMLCLPPSGDAPQLTTQLFAGTTLGGGMGNPPKYDGTDTWPVEPGLLSDPMDPLSASVVFKNSSVVNNVFDAGKDAIFVISVPVRTQNSSTSIKLTLYNARIKMTLAADRKSATKGMIGGVLNTEEFVAEMKKVGYLLQLCGNPLFDNLVTQVRQASDILSDGTQDPSKECDGITMGLGFDMYGANIGDVGPANPVGMACP